MNKSILKKLVLTLCIICAVSFTLFFVFAIKSLNSVKNSKKPYTLGITKDNIQSFVKNIEDNNNVNESPVSDSATSDIDGVTNLKVNSLSSTITFSKSKDTMLHATLEGGITANFTPKLEVLKVGDTLNINVTHKTSFMTINNSDLKLNIEVPENYTGSLYIKNDSGNIKSLDNFNLNNLDLSCDSGNIELSNITSKSTSIKCDSGNLNLNNCDFTKLNFDLDSGNTIINNYNGSIEGKADSCNITITYENLNNDINISLDSGSIDLNLPKGSDFNLDALCQSGTIKCAHPLIYENLGENKEHIKGKSGNGKNSIILKVDSGNIRIN